jgi:hypothetical protein
MHEKPFRLLLENISEEYLIVPATRQFHDVKSRGIIG